MTIITLTTDFGHQDPYVGVMKGVILGLCPEARIVDLVHDLPPHRPEAAAFALWTAAPYFPAGTIHVAVVDPGVGSSRAILALKAGGQVFLAPDNGLLSYVLEFPGPQELRRLENPMLWRPTVSSTFHGRDIFAPAAAHLALGTPFDNLGPTMPDPVRLPALAAIIRPDGLYGRVIHVDRFGNLITNLPVDAAAAWPAPFRIEAGPARLDHLAESYSQVESGEYVAVRGSHGFIEIARNQARAEQPPGLTVGAPVRLVSRIPRPKADAARSIDAEPGRKP